MFNYLLFRISKNTLIYFSFCPTPFIISNLQAKALVFIRRIGDIFPIFYRGVES